MSTTDSPDRNLTPPPPPATRRRWPVVLLTTLVTLAVLAVGLNLFLSRFLDGERLASWVAPRVETAVNRPVTLESVEVALFPLGVRMAGLSVEDPTGLAPELAAVSSVEFRVRLLPLLRRQVQVREIVVDGMTVNLRVGEDSLTNFGDFSPSQAPRGAGDAAPGEVDGDDRPFALALDEIRLRDGSLTFESRLDSGSLAVSELEGRAAVRRDADGPWTFDGQYAASVSGNLLPPPLASPLPVALEAAARLPGDFGQLALEAGTLRLGPVEIRVSGRVDALKEPTRRVALELRADGIPVADVLSLVPTPTPGSDWSGGGTLALDLEARGPLGPDTIPVVTGEALLDGAAVALDGTSLARDVSGTVELSPDRVIRPDLSGRLLDGDFRLGGVLVAGTEPSMDVNVAAAPDLARIPAGFLPPGVSVSGRLPLELRIAGDPVSPESLGIWGTLGLRNVRFVHPAIAVPVETATADLVAEGGRARLEPAGLRVGEDRIEVAGNVAGMLSGLNGGVPEFRGRATGPRFDLVPFTVDPAADTALTWGRIAFARVGGRTVRGGSAEDAARALGLERPARLPLAGEVDVALDTVLDRRGRMLDLRAHLIFSPDFIDVEEATFRRYGGRISTSGALELGDAAQEPFTLRLQASGVDAGEFLGETTPLGRAVTGTLDLDVDLAGALDGLLLPSRESLAGSGSFRLTGGGIDAGPLGDRLADFLGIRALATPTVDDWATGFVLRDGRVVLQEAELRGAPGDPRLGGGIGLNGTLDLVSAFDLPREELAADALDRLGLPAGVAGADVVDAVLRVGGTLSDPEIRADPAAAVSTVTGAVEERARTEVEERVREQRENLRERATGVLRGLLGGTRRAPPPSDTVRALPDSVPADSARADTLPPDSTRPDSTPPDTTRPDTIRPDTSGVARASRSRT